MWHLSVFCEFGKVCKTRFIQKTARTWGIHKDLQKETASDAFEQLVPSGKGKMVIDQCFESIKGEVY